LWWLFIVLVTFDLVITVIMLVVVAVVVIFRCSNYICPGGDSYYGCFNGGGCVVFDRVGCFAGALVSAVVIVVKS
jgi:hypothetical protein